MKFKINRALLPFKLHNFAFFGGIAFVMPYMSDYAADRGISAFLIGCLFTIMPFCALLAKIGLGSLADYFQSHKLVLLTSLIVVTASYFSIVLIPNVSETTCSSIESHFKCDNDSVKICAPEVSQCQENNSNPLTVKCTISCNNCAINDSSCQWMFNDSNPYDLHVENSCISFPQWNFSTVCSQKNSTCETSCSCKLMENDDNSSIYTSWQFILLYLLMIISYGVSGTVISLADTITLDILQENHHLFGQQRLWGTMGWGICVIISGQVFTMASEGHCNTNYNPGFYILLVILIIDFVILCKAEVKSNPKPKEMLKQVIEIFKLPSVAVFASAVFVIGFSTGSLWTFLVIFIRKTLSGPAILPGLAMGVQTWGGELLFFLLSGPILRKFGNVTSMCLSLGATGFRYIIYSILWNPWLILPVELMNGLTFGLFFANMASYASSVAPEGMSATMQGVFQSIFEGFGVGFGSLISGYLYDQYGGREMYRIVGIGTIIYGIFFAVIMFFLTRKKKEYQFPSQETIENEMKQASDNASFEHTE